MYTKLCIILIVIGLIGLYFVSEFVTPEFVDIQNINEKYLGKKIRTEGFVKSHFYKNSILFLTLEKNGKSIKVVKFNTEKLNIAKGSYIEVSGEVKKYKNYLEIVADKIVVKDK